MYYTYLKSPVGPFFLAGDGTSLSLASFTTGHQCREPEPGWVHDPLALSFAVEQVEEYFAGERRRFDLPLEIAGTEFQQSAWRVLQSIPFGETWTYRRVAQVLGKPSAYRAVGSANAANSLPLIIPCHRLVGTKGQLTGFGGGLETKKWLLEFEGAHPKTHQPRDSSDDTGGGVRLTTGVS